MRSRPEAIRAFLAEASDIEDALSVGLASEAVSKFHIKQTKGHRTFREHHPSDADNHDYVRFVVERDDLLDSRHNVAMFKHPTQGFTTTFSAVDVREAIAADPSCWQPKPANTPEEEPMDCECNDDAVEPSGAPSAVSELPLDTTQDPEDEPASPCSDSSPTSTQIACKVQPDTPPHTPPRRHVELSKLRIMTNKHWMETDTNEQNRLLSISDTHGPLFLTHNPSDLPIMGPAHPHTRFVTMPSHSGPGWGQYATNAASLFANNVKKVMRWNNTAANEVEQNKDQAAFYLLGAIKDNDKSINDAVKKNLRAKIAFKIYYQVLKKLYDADFNPEPFVTIYKILGYKQDDNIQLKVLRLRENQGIWQPNPEKGYKTNTENQFLEFGDGEDRFRSYNTENFIHPNYIGDKIQGIRSQRHQGTVKINGTPTDLEATNLKEFEEDYKKDKIQTIDDYQVLRIDEDCVVTESVGEIKEGWKLIRLGDEIETNRIYDKYKELDGSETKDLVFDGYVQEYSLLLECVDEFLTNATSSKRRTDNSPTVPNYRGKLTYKPTPDGDALGTIEIKGQYAMKFIFNVLKLYNQKTVKNKKPFKEFIDDFKMTKDAQQVKDLVKAATSTWPRFQVDNFDIELQKAAVTWSMYEVFETIWNDKNDFSEEKNVEEAANVYFDNLLPGEGSSPPPVVSVRDPLPQSVTSPPVRAPQWDRRRDKVPERSTHPDTEGDLFASQNPSKPEEQKTEIDHLIDEYLSLSSQDNAPGESVEVVDIKKEYKNNKDFGAFVQARGQIYYVPFYKDKELAKAQDASMTDGSMGAVADMLLLLKKYYDNDTNTTKTSIIESIEELAKQLRISIIKKNENVVQLQLEDGDKSNDSKVSVILPNDHVILDRFSLKIPDNVDLVNQDEHFDAIDTFNRKTIREQRSALQKAQTDLEEIEKKLTLVEEQNKKLTDETDRLESEKASLQQENDNLKSDKDNNANFEEQRKICENEKSKLLQEQVKLNEKITELLENIRGAEDEAIGARFELATAKKQLTQTQDNNRRLLKKLHNEQLQHSYTGAVEAFFKNQPINKDQLVLILRTIGITQEEIDHATTNIEENDTLTHDDVKHILESVHIDVEALQSLSQENGKLEMRLAAANDTITELNKIHKQKEDVYAKKKENEKVREYRKVNEELQNKYNALQKELLSAQIQLRMQYSTKPLSDWISQHIEFDISPVYRSFEKELDTSPQKKEELWRELVPEGQNKQTITMAEVLKFLEKKGMGAEGLKVAEDVLQKELVSANNPEKLQEKLLTFNSDSTEVVELRRDYNIQLRQNAQLLEKIGTLEQQVKAEVDQKIAALKQKETHHKQEIGELEQSVREYHDRVEACLKERVVEQNQYNDQLRKLNEQITKLTAEKEKADNTMKNLRHRLLQHTQQNTTKKKQNDTLHERDQTRIDLQGKLAEAVKKSERSENEIAELKTLVHDLQRKLGQKKSTTTETQNQQVDMNALQLLEGNLEDSLRETTQDISESIKRLNEKRSNRSKNATNQEQEIRELQNKLENQQNIIRELKRLAEENKTKYNEKLVELQRSQRIKEALHKTIHFNHWKGVNKWNEQYDKLEKDMRLLAQNYKKAKTLNTNYIEQLKRYENEIAQLKVELNDSKQEQVEDAKVEDDRLARLWQLLQDRDYMDSGIASSEEKAEALASELLTMFQQNNGNSAPEQALQQAVQQIRDTLASLQEVGDARGNQRYTNADLMFAPPGFSSSLPRASHGWGVAQLYFSKRKKEGCANINYASKDGVMLSFQAKQALALYNKQNRCWSLVH